MTEETKNEIVNISKEFTEGLGIPINESGWLVVDPLSGFLGMSGYHNTVKQLPASDKHPQVLIIVFLDGTQLIPAGGDLKSVDPTAENWLWL